jgi:hypothetical protein
MSDKFGRRWFVIGASTMGFIGGIIACRAHNMNTLVGANVRLSLSPLLFGFGTSNRLTSNPI